MRRFIQLFAVSFNMNRSIVLLITSICIACSGLNKEKIIALYNDKSGFKIKTSIPDEWVDYTNVRRLTDENLLFKTVKGTKDTSSWVVLDIYEYKALDAKQLNVDSILNW